MDNPFTERGRITDPSRFAGRWSELSLIFDAIQAGRPVLVSGTPAIGKSSLLTHIADAAATNLERDDLRAFYLDLAGASGAADIYRVVSEALRHRGDTPAALEVALLSDDAPTVLCLDNAHEAIAAGWGEGLLEALARMVRAEALLLVVAVDGQAPLLSERFSYVRLGAFAPAEVSLLVEAYLDGTGVQFAGEEVRALVRLSAGHPAYVQRAAFHLFRAKLEPGYDWRRAYLSEARDRPVPGAPLPPAVFQGEGMQGGESGPESGAEGQAALSGPQAVQLPVMSPALVMLLPLLAAALALVLTGSVPLAVAAAAVGAAGVLLLRRRPSR